MHSLKYLKFPQTRKLWLPSIFCCGETLKGKLAQHTVRHMHTNGSSIFDTARQLQEKWLSLATSNSPNLKLTALLYCEIWCTHAYFTKLEALDEAKVFRLTLIRLYCPKSMWLGRHYAYPVCLQSAFQIKVSPERSPLHLGFEGMPDAPQEPRAWHQLRGLAFSGHIRHFLNVLSKLK